MNENEISYQIIGAALKVHRIVRLPNLHTNVLWLMSQKLNERSATITLPLP
jgi:hypothetical protein